MGQQPRAWGEVAWARVRAGIAFASLAAGIVLARSLSGPGLEPPAPPWLFFTVAAVTGVAGCMLSSFGRRGAWAARCGLALAAGLLGAGWWTLRVCEAPARAFAVAHDEYASIEAMVLRAPRRDEPDSDPLRSFLHRAPALRFPVRVRGTIAAHESAGSSAQRAIEPSPAPGVVVWTIVERGDVPAGPGDVVRLAGRFRGVDAPTNPGASDPRPLAWQAGAAGSLRVPTADLVQVLPGGGGWRAAWTRAREAARARAARVIDLAGGDPDGRALLHDLLLGDAAGEDPELRGAFARQGLSHVLSISGFHLAVMAGLALGLLRLTGDRGWVEPAAVAGVVLAYVWIVPPASPLTRSAAMVLVLLASEALGRRYDRVTLLAWIGVGLLLWRPHDLWSLGFQLSLGLTGLLLWAGPGFHARMWGSRLAGSRVREPGALVRLARWAATSVSTAMMCWVVALPVVARAAGVVSPVAVVTTVIITPLFVVLLWAGYLALAVGLVVPAWASHASGVLGLLAETAAWSVRGIDALPATSFRVPPVSAAWAIAATISAALWARLGDLRRWRWWALAGALGAWLGGEWALARGLPQGVVLRVDTLDVGDGTCHLVRSGEECLLWDVGPLRAARGAPLPELTRVAREVGAWRVPVAVISHPDLDHYAGVLDAAGTLGLGRVYVPPRFDEQATREPRGPAGTARAWLRAQGVEVVTLGAGEEFTLGRCRVRILSPPPGADWPADNDHSIVAQIRAPTRAGERVFVMTGDAGDAPLEGLTVPGDAMELPHHGSARVPAMEFVARSGAATIVQSTGPRRLDDPRWNSLREGRRWLVTARDGAIRTEIFDSGEVRSRGFVTGRAPR